MRDVDVWIEFQRDFFERMKLRLSQADGRDTSKTVAELNEHAVFRHFYEEYEELRRALNIREGNLRHHSKETNIDVVLKELADLANMCGFLYIKLRELGY